MDTDDDRDIKVMPNCQNSTNTTTPSSSSPVLNSTNNATTNNSSNNNNTSPLKVKEEIKEEPMDIDKSVTENKKSEQKDKSPIKSEPSDTPLVNGVLSDSEKEPETTVSCQFLFTA